MRHGYRFTRAMNQHVTALARKIDPPRPFTLDGLGSSLERHCQRAVHMVSITMTPGDPSGVWLRSEGADFLFYEERTSAFHQAHIACSLAAHLLAAGTPEGRIDRRLIPNVDPRPTGMLPGTEVGNAVSRSEAEMFALEVLRQDGLFPGTLQARLLLRRLWPLRSALVAAVPSAAEAGVAASAPSQTAVYRLYRAVVEIRDAALALRPYGAPGMSAAATTHGPTTQTAGRATAAAAAAEVVSATSVTRWDTGRPAASAAVALPADLGFEAATLAQASQTFVRSVLQRP